jgi:RHS repeat-associated protein
LFYDSCANGIGRLCSTSDQSGTTDYAYDTFGNVTAHQGVAYTYDAADRVLTMTYLSGAIVSYGYDAAGQVESVTLDEGNSVRTLASGIAYKPFGPMATLTYGFGGVLTQAFDDQYRMTSQALPGVYEATYPDYDANGNLRNRTDDLAGAASTFTYDALDRLDTGAGPFGTRDYDLDPNGNRLLLSADGIDTTYTYTPVSNRLETETGWTYTRDASGNRTAKLDVDGLGFFYAYNHASSLASVTERRRVTLHKGRGKGLDDAPGKGRGQGKGEDNGKGRSTTTEIQEIVLASYAYNALGQRATKAAADTTTRYVYGLKGELLAELAEGVVKAEYIWLNGRPFAYLLPADGGASSGRELHYIHTDHLGTPQALSNEAGVVVWRAVYDPFGAAVIDEDPDEDRVGVVFNLRFSGQYYDAESGLHYNYARYYDPGTGRYLTADPIGLQGGPNTYAYVLNNPLSYVDPFGLIGGRNNPPNRKPRPPGNGNLWPGFDPQDGICTSPAGGFNDNECTKRCCEEHDACYARYGCNYSSWITSVFGGSGPCNYCNSRAARCIQENRGKESCDEEPCTKN